MRCTSSSVSAGIYAGMAIGNLVGTMVGRSKPAKKLRLSGVKQFTRLLLPRGHLSDAFGLKPRRLRRGGNHVENRSVAVERNESRDRPSGARSALTAGASRTAADN